MITKIAAAEKQLDTAIRLFFENIDHLSSYTLTNASREITDDLCEKKKNELLRRELARVGDPQKVFLSFREELRIHVKEEYFGQAMGLVRRMQNFLKHADRDPDAETDDITVNQLALMIMMAVKNFSLLEERQTPAMVTFFAWYLAANPEDVRDDIPMNPQLEKALSGLRETFSDLYSAEAFYMIYEALKMANGAYRPYAGKAADIPFSLFPVRPAG
jgi:hypothetical protein